MNTPSIVDRVGVSRLMRDLLGDRKIKNGVTNCVNPAAHKNGDKNPSMSVDIEKGTFNCFTCGIKGGALDLAVALAVGRDRADAAAQLEIRYPEHPNGHPNGNGHAPTPQPPRPWPYFPKLAEKLGWEVGLAGDRRMMRLPTWAPGGKKGRTKIRYEKHEDERTAEFENDADICGLINLPALRDACAGSEHPTAVLLAGETDFLAWTWACTENEGLLAVGVSHSTGENASLEAWASEFRDCHVIVLYDNDATGRKEAPKRVAEIKAGGAASVKAIFVPDPYKDVCEYVMAGDTARALLNLAADAAEPTAPDLYILDDLLMAQFPPPTPMIDGLVDEGQLILLYGPSGVGKSWLAWAIALDLACGSGEILDLAIVGSSRNVLLVLGEDTRGRAQARFNALVSAKTGVLATTPLYPAFPPSEQRDLATPAGQKWLEAQLAETKASVLMLDNLTALFFGDAKDDAESKKFLAYLDSIRTRFGLTIFLLAHTKKSQGGEKGGAADRLFGSHVWSSLSDVCLMLDELEDQPTSCLFRHVKSRDHVQLPNLILAKPDPDDHSPRHRVLADTTRKGEPTKSVLDFVAALSGGKRMTVAEFASLWGVSKKSVTRWLKKYLALKDSPLEVDVVTTGRARTPYYLLSPTRDTSGHE